MLPALTRFHLRAGLALLLLVSMSSCAPASPLPAFYTAATTEAHTRPGTLIRQEPLPDPPAGGKAWRILYWSRGLDNQPVAISGMVILPEGPAPAEGRAIIGWAHPTTGVQPRCAPSLSPLRFQMISGLRAMVRQGYIVAASDYPGLGAGTDHPFLDGPSEGRAVLDAVRAAAQLPGATASHRFALWGHSQGGQAVLFAAAMARDYASEYNLAAVAAAAPATDLAALFRDDLGSKGGNNLTALTLWAWNRNYGASYDPVIAPPARAAVATIADKCIDTLIESRAKRAAGRILAQQFLTVPDLTAIEPWRSLAARNQAPSLPGDIPVFLAQGEADTIVSPALTRTYMARLCTTGSHVTFMPMADVGHGWIAAKSADSAIGWISDRLAGTPQPNDCARITPPLHNIFR